MKVTLGIAMHVTSHERTLILPQQIPIAGFPTPQTHFRHFEACDGLKLADKALGIR